jgi:hypothetical protein
MKQILSKTSLRLGRNGMIALGIVTVLLLALSFTVLARGLLGTQGSVAAPDAVQALTCEIDNQGANDEPGQKDLTKMCADYSNVPTSERITWQWDEIAWTGNNTGDACSLYDINSNGKADYALCVTVGGNPAEQLTGIGYYSPRLYSCDDSNAYKCSGATLLKDNQTLTSTCSVAVTDNVDPFPAGAAYQKDTVADCTVQLSEVGAGSTAALLDVCSFPSQQPNSDPSDCIKYAPKTGTVQILKVLSPSTDPGRFDLFVDGGDPIVSNIGDGGDTGKIIVSAGTHTLSEDAYTGTSLADYTTTYSCSTGQSGTGTSVDVTVAVNDDIVCTFTNTRNTGSIELKKIWSGTGGQTTLKIGTTAGGAEVDSQLTGANGAAPLTTGANTVDTGTFYVSETGGLDNYDSALACTKNGQAYTPGANNSVVVGKNDVVVCTFTNTRHTGTIELKKVWVGGAGIVDLKIGTTASGSEVKLVTLTNANGTTGTTTVETGSYYVSETDLAPQYDAVLACENQKTTPATIVTPGANNMSAVGKGDKIVCTYTNTKRATISGSKWRDKEPFGVWDALENYVSLWPIDLWKWDGSKYVFVEQVKTNLGKYEFKYLVPGKYAVCEVALPYWNQTFPTAGFDCSTLDVKYGKWGYEFTLAPGDVKENNNFGNYRLPGCVLTQGYWKNHSDKDKQDGKFYNSAWDYVGGPYAEFFDTGVSWIDILSTPSAAGNAYYILAHQYIAAILNGWNGADTDFVSGELANAEALLIEYQEELFIDKNDPNRAIAISLAGILDMFNNGDYGVPHCDY